MGVHPPYQEPHAFIIPFHMRRVCQDKEGPYKLINKIKATNGLQTAK